MIRILIWLLLLGFSARAQTLTGASVDPTGWRLDLYFSGLGTNGTFELGWSTNNQPSASNRVVLNLERPGFAPSPTGPYPTNWTAVGYGTHRVRFPYPGDAFPDTAIHGSGVRVTVGLSHCLLASDTNITVTLLQGVYTSGGTNSASASSQPVTNLSAQVAPYGIADFERTTSWNRWTNSPQRVYLKGGAGLRVSPPNSLTMFRPLAGVAFVATDLFGNSVTNFVSDPTIDSSFDQLIPSARYQADIDLSSMSNRSPIRIDFVAWPFIGTSNAILDTRNNLFTGVHSGPIAITNLWDPLQEYSQAVAIVDPSGNDTNGVTTTPGNFLTHTNYFLTTAKAAHAIRTNNATHTWVHDDVGGGIIYVRDGTTNWLGGSQSYGTNPLAHIRIINYPGHSPTYTTVSGNQDISDRIQLEGIGIGGTGNLFNSINYLTLRDCRIDSSNSMGLFATCPVIWLIDCEIPQVANGLRPVATHNTSFRMSNCDLNGYYGTLNPRTMVGCYHPEREGASPFVLQQDTSSGQQASTDFFIWADNIMGGLQNTSLAWYFGQNKSIQYGGYIANNVFPITTNAGPCVFNFGGSVYHHTNIVLHHNIWYGKRAAGYGYNQTGTNAAWRVLWSTIGNIWENFGYKDDVFTGDGGADGNRIGNWALMWGVDHHHNIQINCNTTGGEAPASFVPYFFGTVSYHPLTTFTNFVDWPKMVDPRSVGYPSLEGEGDYRYQADSPVGQQFTATRDIPLPYDLDGLRRTAYDPPGPFGSNLRPAVRPVFDRVRAINMRIR